MSRTPESNERRRTRFRPLRSLAALAAMVACSALTTGCSAVIGGGVLAVGVVASILTYDCDEAASVTVWDRTTSHPVCDATLVATQGKHRVVFSPCYSAFLGDGDWTITATKPGYQPAIGTVGISPTRHCARPTYHSLELTLLQAPAPAPAL